MILRKFSHCAWKEKMKQNQTESWAHGLSRVLCASRLTQEKVKWGSKSWRYFFPVVNRGEVKQKGEFFTFLSCILQWQYCGNYPFCVGKRVLQFDWLPDCDTEGRLRRSLSNEFPFHFPTSGGIVSNCFVVKRTERPRSLDCKEGRPNNRQLFILASRATYYRRFLAWLRLLSNILPNGVSLDIPVLRILVAF